MEFSFEIGKLNRLACRMKKGDSRAAAALYDELAPKVFGFCFSRIRLKHVAEDLTQEIFVKLLEKIDTFDDMKGNFPVWFWRFVRNHLIDYYREKKIQPFSDFSDDVIESASLAHPQRAIDSRLETDRLRAFIGSLDDDEQNLFELRYVAELSYKQIAEIVSKSEGSLRVAASRLKQKIRKNFIS
jgi:RNA polymerase sigma-70 factor (ECF subfamily)